jgi:hypothetical protein
VVLIFLIPRFKHMRFDVVDVYPNYNTRILFAGKNGRRAVLVVSCTVPGSSIDGTQLHNVGTGGKRRGRAVTAETVCHSPRGSGLVNMQPSIGGMCMFTNLNTDPNKKPRLIGELGDLSHAKVSSSEFKYSQGTEIFGQAGPANYIYQVIEGAVRSHKLLSDGRRQIGAFHLRGDIFGFENSDLSCTRFG